MIRFIRTFTPALAVAAALGACTTNVTYFAGPDHELISPASINGLAPAPTPVRVEVLFTRNGRHIPGADRILRREVIRTLDETTVFRAVDDPNVGSVLSVTVDDVIGESELASGSYFASGLTHGGSAMSHITDRYEFKLQYHAESGQERFAHDQHSIWTNVGNEVPPSLRGPYATPQRAFRLVVEDVILSFLKDIATSSDTPDSLMFVPNGK